MYWKYSNVIYTNRQKKISWIKVLKNGSSFCKIKTNPHNESNLLPIITKLLSIYCCLFLCFSVLIVTDCRFCKNKNLHVLLKKNKLNCWRKSNWIIIVKNFHLSYLIGVFRNIVKELAKSLVGATVNVS